MADQLESQPPPSSAFLLSYPSPSVLLVTINKPKQRNSVSMGQHWEADAIFKWFDNEPSLSVAIITGSGPLAFCAGQDLKEQASMDRTSPTSLSRIGLPSSGFAGLSMRTGRKPVIAAVNGVAVGGGFEICLNCDVVIAAPHATFGLPEALRGLYAGAGGLARLMRIVGLQVASELALTGRTISATEAKELRVINSITASKESLVDEAIAMAQAIAKSSPDAVIVTRAGIREAWETASIARAQQITSERFNEKLFTGENFYIGVGAFAQKEQPKWVASKL